MIVGCIGDDFTGSSDVGLALRQGGLRTVQYVGVPGLSAPESVEAGVVSLKIRSAPVSEAIEQAVKALNWLKDQGCAHYIYKICSTFDSTPRGNIGPVMDALIDELGIDVPVAVCPAAPAVGRTVYQGHLFVFDKLLNESGMQNHPLTPMTDADIRRWLQSQTRCQTGHVSLEAIRSGHAHSKMREEHAAGHQAVIFDAISDADLITLSETWASLPLIIGAAGAGFAMAHRLSDVASSTDKWSGVSGPSIALSGSCSQTTRRQVEEHARAREASLKVTALDVLSGDLTPEMACDWALQQRGTPLIFSSDDPAAVTKTQSIAGTGLVAESLETFFGQLARLAVDSGFRRIIVAGGETSGAVVNELEINRLEIGPVIDVGVPALLVSNLGVALALKSGNFGGIDFFTRAAKIMGAS